MLDINPNLWYTLFMDTTAKWIIETLVAKGHRAALVGGCVRDTLLGREPKDWDVVTSALPDEVEAIFPHSLPIGKAFGVITVSGVEVATLRKDGDYVDGRHPEGVTFTKQYMHDGDRRDFTMNALYMEDDGFIFDFHDGQRHISEKRIVAVGDPRKRFAEDRLRMLRAVRFACLLGFAIDDEVYTAIVEAAQHITEVSGERIRVELIKILESDNAGIGLVLLDQTGLLEHILPEVTALKGVAQPVAYHPEGDAFVHTIAVVMGAPKHLRVAALFHDVGKAVESNGHEKHGVAIAEKAMRRLKFTNDEIEHTVYVTRNHMKMHKFLEMRLAKQKEMIAHPMWNEMIQFVDADDMINRKPSTAILSYVASIPAEEVDPEPLITGHDLLAAGMPQGARMGRALKAMREMQLEDPTLSKQLALNLAMLVQ